MFREELEMFVKDAGLRIVKTSYAKRWWIRSERLGKSAVLLIQKPVN